MTRPEIITMVGINYHGRYLVSIDSFTYIHTPRVIGSNFALSMPPSAPSRGATRVPLSTHNVAQDCYFVVLALSYISG